MSLLAEIEPSGVCCKNDTVAVTQNGGDKALVGEFVKPENGTNYPRTGDSAGNSFAKIRRGDQVVLVELHMPTPPVKVTNNPRTS